MCMGATLIGIDRHWFTALVHWLNLVAVGWCCSPNKNMVDPHRTMVRAGTVFVVVFFGCFFDELRVHADMHTLAHDNARNDGGCGAVVGAE